LVGKPEGKRPLGIPRYRREVIIRIDLRKTDGRWQLDSSGLGYGPVAGSCEHGNEHLIFIKDREFLD